MTIKNLDTIEALEAFLQGNQPVAFAVLRDKTDRYDFIRKTRVKMDCMNLSKKDKGVVIRYLMKMTEYSRQQLTRLIKKYTHTGKINWTPSRRNGFTKKYTNRDIPLLAKTDERHDTPCGHAVKNAVSALTTYLMIKPMITFQKSLFLTSTISEVPAITTGNVAPSQKHSLVRCLLAKEESLSLMGSPVIFASIRFIKAIRIK